MSKDTTDGADPTTDADEAALDRALTSGRPAAGSGQAQAVSTSSSSPGVGSATLVRPDGSPAARRQPESE
ncbi:hypothetical protein [Streptomyces sp. DSM 40907]|uniref:hypothetical protein n=1 Tax=Streptomyces kutzneri TaxID=3051179 RepID=UPI0028D30B63|nr:hypothetical protein [Streptomyces sp. DSM 40907]